jgi:hypothetical protein
MRTPGFTAEVSLQVSANRYHVPGRTHRAGHGVHSAQASLTDLTLGTTEGSVPTLGTPSLPPIHCYWRWVSNFYPCVKVLGGMPVKTLCRQLTREFVCNAP